MEYAILSLVYGLDLEKHLMSDTSGHFKRLMVSLASVRLVLLILRGWWVRSVFLLFVFSPALSEEEEEEEELYLTPNRQMYNASHNHI